MQTEIEIQDLREENGTRYATVDLGAQGWVAQEKVDQIAQSQYRRGAEAMRAEYETRLKDMQSELEKARSLQAGSGLEDVSRLRDDYEKLSASFRELREKYDAGLKKERELRLEAQIQTAASSLDLVEGGSQVFALMAKQDMCEDENEDFCFHLSDGLVGNIKDYAKSWSLSSVAKNLLKSQQKGGTGTHRQDAGATKPQEFRSVREYRAYRSNQL